MAKSHKLKIMDIRRETENSISVSFTVPENLNAEYKFIQGQYVTLILTIDGNEVRRSYSICSAPFENELRIAVKQVKDGKVSNYIKEKLKVGDEVEVMIPAGNFHSPISSAHHKQYVLFAGGSGITPVFSVLKTVLWEEPNSYVILFYGNVDEDVVIFKQSLNQLVAEYSNRLKVLFFFEKPKSPQDPILTGMLTEDKIKILVKNYIDLTKDYEFFVCGPTSMMDNVRKVVDDLSLEKGRLHIEYFTAATIDDPIKKIYLSDKVIAQVTVVLDGQETKFDLASDSNNILDAALDLGLDAPYSCKDGVCSSCRAKVLEGRVHMDKNFGLSDGEVEDGYVLTCQSHPLTPVVKVNYDA